MQKNLTMKSIWTFCCLLLATGLFAQPPAITTDVAQYVNGSGKIYVAQVLAHNSYATKLQKPTATKQRVIAQVYHSDISVADSVVFVYNSNERGSTYRFTPWDDVGQYRYHLFVGNHIVEHAYQSQDSYGVMADSFIVYNPEGEINMQSVPYYNAANTYDSFYNSYIWAGDTSKFRCRIRYNADGSIDSVLDDTLYPGDDTYVTTQKIVYSYEDGIAVGDTTYGDGPDFWRAAAYHYNTDGKADTITVFYDYGSITVSTFVAFAYTAEGNVKTAHTYQLSEGSYYLNHKDSFGYTTGFDYPTYYEGVQGLLTGPEPEGYRYRFYADDGSLPDSLIAEEFTGDAPWTFSRSAYYTYNDYGNPEHIVNYWAGWPEDRITNFYYEEYDDDLSINMPQQLLATLYPNPCAGYVYIACKESGVFAISISDIAGKQMMDGFIKGDAYVNTVDISALPPGVYSLRIVGEGIAGFNKLIISK